MPKRQRTELAPVVKKDICLYWKSHPSASQDKIAAEVRAKHGLKIRRSTVGDDLRSSEKWLAYEDDCPSATRLPTPKHEECALFLWHSELNARRVAHSDEMLQTTAKEFGEKLGISDFGYSKGWLVNFKKRFGIKQFVRHGEAVSVDTEVVQYGRGKLKELLRNYLLSDVYNFDETGLFFRLEPNLTLATAPIRG